VIIAVVDALFYEIKPNPRRRRIAVVRFDPLMTTAR
jgi:hypothetical protein